MSTFSIRLVVLNTAFEVVRYCTIILIVQNILDEFIDICFPLRIQGYMEPVTSLLRNQQPF